MAYVNFGRKNTREEALTSTNKDKVFFPTDATSIILGGKEYGVGANNKSINLIDYIEEGSTFKLDGSTFNYMGMPLESRILLIGESSMLIFRVLKSSSDDGGYVDGFIVYRVDSEPDSDGLLSAYFEGIYNLQDDSLSIINLYFNPVLDVALDKLHVRKHGEWVEIDDYITEEELLEEVVNFVDLGLPSGTLWSDRALGANSETESGYTYRWGETLPCEGVANYFDTIDGTYTSSKYGTGSKQKYYLDLLDDAANAVLGENCTIPSYTLFRELYNNCTVTKETINGKKCYRLTGPNGNSIVFTGSYWCNTICKKTLVPETSYNDDSDSSVCFYVWEYEGTIYKSTVKEVRYSPNEIRAVKASGGYSRKKLNSEFLIGYAKVTDLPNPDDFVCTSHQVLSDDKQKRVRAQINAAKIPEEYSFYGNGTTQTIDLSGNLLGKYMPIPTNRKLSSLTLTGITPSFDETIITFSTGESCSFSIPDSTQYIGDLTLLPNTDYIISILNGILIIKEVLTK